MNNFSSLLRKTIAKSLKTSKWILSITLPSSLVVTLAAHFGFINWISQHLSFLFHYLGLPGEASIVFLSSIFLPLYAPIALISTLPLTLRDVTILTSMCLITHNLPVESGVQKKIGMPIWLSVSLRISVSIVCAFLLNLVLPEKLSQTLISEGNAVMVDTTLLDSLRLWLVSSLWLCLKLISIITSLMFVQEVFKYYNLFHYITRSLAPVMRVFGLKKESSYLWVVAQIVGLAYSAGIMEEEAKGRCAGDRELQRLNLHIAVNHSIVEDSLLFVMLGVSWWWIILPKTVFAIVIVWSSHYVRPLQGSYMLPHFRDSS